jgi:hypothetical protein
MRPVQWWLALVIAFAMLAGAPDGTRGGTTANPEVEPQAMVILDGMVTTLAQAKHFSVTVDIGYDVVQDSGQRIEFGETRTIIMRRPDHLRIDTVNRDGSQRGFIFDGKTLAVFDVDDKV